MRRCACIVVWELLAILGLTKNPLYSEFPDILKGKASEMKKSLVDIEKEAKKKIKAATTLDLSQ